MTDDRLVRHRLRLECYHANLGAWTARLQTWKDYSDLCRLAITPTPPLMDDLADPVAARSNMATPPATNTKAQPMDFHAVKDPLVSDPNGLSLGVEVLASSKGTATLRMVLTKDGETLFAAPARILAIGDRLTLNGVTFNLPVTSWPCTGTARSTAPSAPRRR